MRRRGGALASLALATALLAVAVSPRVAYSSPDPISQLRPIDLRVSSEAAWQAESRFRLDWEQPPIAGPGFPIAAVGYRVRSGAGVVIPEVRLARSEAGLEISLSEKPGIYTADVWLEGPEGGRGPEASVALRFDNTRPRAARPLAPASWIPGSRPAVLRIEHPAGPHPISGIRGYAVAVDRAGESAPCASPAWCSVAETDLRGGIGDDTVSLGILPEGASVVHAVAVSGSGMRSAEIGSAIVWVDSSRPEVTLSGPGPGWANGPVWLAAKATDALSGMAADGPSGPFTAIAVDGGVPRLEHGDSVAAMVTGEGAHGVAFYARDATGNTGEAAPARVTVRIDESGPEVAFSRFQDPAEPERIEATAGDRLAGLDPARGSIAVRRARSLQPWAPLPTATGAGRLVAHWDSDSFPAGTYEFKATAYDLAGNPGFAERRGNGTRMVLSNPLKARATIAAGFGGRRLAWRRCGRKDGQRRCRREAIDTFEQRPTRRSVPYGRAVSYAGRLASAAGPGLGGLPISIVESFAAGADPSQRTTTTRTAADGSFATRLAPGPSRWVEVVFDGTPTLARASGGEVSLGVLGGIRMRASAASARVGGAPVAFDGRVGEDGAPIPPGGRPVELQFRLPGRDWSEFRTVQTDAHGRFRYAYSFSDDDSRGVRFQFRAFAPAQDGWPYEPAASTPVFVTGR